MSSGDQSAMFAVEAEAYCQSLESFKLKQIGSPNWNRQHEKLEKLNMQAIINASAQENEFVKEYLINEGKFPLIVKDLITTEIWKNKIFTELIAQKFEPKITFPLYMVLYHEATIVNLLETTLYYQESCEACGDTILDLVDYCHRKFAWLTTRSSEEYEEEDEEKLEGLGNSMKELVKQADSLEFDIALKALSLVRYLSDHLSALPLSTASRLLNTHDIPVLLVELMQLSPWTRTNERGHLEKYVETRWTEVDASDRFKITKVEGQVWLTLYKLLMDQECQRKYELDPTRKNTLLKLRSHLNETLLDQIPVLSSMHMYLEHLSMMQPPAAKHDLILEQVPEIYDGICSNYRGKWKSVAAYQIEKFFNPNEIDLRDQAKRWADTYSFDTMESLIPEDPKCAVCGQPATKRCSRCQNEWYCRRECQVSAWKKHKTACDLMYDSVQKLQETHIST